MKLFRVATFLSVALGCGGAAWGQYYNYGAPYSPQPQQMQRTPYAYNTPMTTNNRYGSAYGQPSGYAAPGPATRPSYRTAQVQPAPSPAPRPAGAYHAPTPAAAPPGMPGLGRSAPVPSAAYANESPGMGDGGYCGYNGCDGPQCGGGFGCYSGCGDCGEMCFPWYVSLRALVMSRDRPNTLFTSAQAADPTQQGHFDDFDWRWGGEITVGRRLNCCGAGFAIEATYWTLDQFATQGGPGIDGPYVTPLNMYGTDMVGTGTTAGDWFNGSNSHWINRSDDVHNVEINLFRTQVLGGGCDPLNVDVFMGARYFKFRDRLIFSAENSNPGTYEYDWIHLDDQVSNEMVGGQIGANVEVRFAPRCKLFVLPKVGLFSNQMILDYNLYAMHGGTYIQGSSPNYQPLDYPVHSSCNVISVLTQVDVGVDFQIAPHLDATIGYRLVAVSGVGLADNQVPNNAADTLAISQIDKNGSLILHGAFAGLTYRF